MNGLQSPGLARATHHADALGLSYTIGRSGAHHDLSLVAGELGIGLSQVVKTMVLYAPRSGFLIALIPGGRTLSWPKLRAELGLNRVTIAKGDVAAEITGYPKGGVSVLGLDSITVVVADNTLRGKRIAIRCGTREHSLIVDADVLLDALQVRTSDITERSVPVQVRKNGL